MIEVYKILTKKCDTITNINFSFETQQDSRTRGHNLKLVCHRHYCDLISGVAGLLAARGGGRICRPLVLVFGYWDYIIFVS